MQINAPVRLLEDTSPEAQAYDRKDGVRVAIQVRGSELWNTEISPDDFSVKNPTNVSGITVTRGDRIYFRVQSLMDGAYDQVAWDPTISYTLLPQDEIDPNCKTPYRYTASEDFILASCQTVSVPINGKIKLTGRFEKPVTSDNVYVHVFTLENGGSLTTVYDSVYSWDSVVVHDILVEDIALDTSQELYFRVSALTNVEWSAIKWTPTITYTEADDGSPVESSDGTPLIQYCPAPEYRMFVDPLSRTIPWIAPGSGTLTVEADFNMGGSESGFATLSAKGPKRPIEFSSFNIIAGNPQTITPLSFDVESGDTLYFEYHILNRAVALDVNQSGVRVELNGGGFEDVNAGLHTSINEEDIIFGPMYRHWGHFVYNGNRARANNPIDESQLMIDQDSDDVDDIGDIDDPDNIDIDFDAAKEPFIVMISDPKNRYWVGSDNLTYIRTDTMSSSRMGEDDILPPDTGSGGSTFVSPAIETRSKINSVAGGGSVGPIGASASASFNTTENILDVFDLNGDRYPDIVKRDMIQYTVATGGLESSARDNNLESHTAHSFAFGASTSVGFVFSSATNSGDVRSARSSGSTRGGNKSRATSKSSKSSRSKRSSSAKSKVNKSGKKSGDASRASKAGVGIDGGFTVDRDSTELTWIDINGDGLVDMVHNDGTVNLNYGYSFGPPEQWGFDDVHEGNSWDYGGGLGLNLFNGSIVAGASLNRTDNESDIGFQDVNSDGLPDMVVSIEPMRVRINTGNGFTSPIEWSGADYFERGSATGESVNGAFTVCIPIVIIGIRICTNPSTSAGRGVSRVIQQLSDIDGDGFVDYLTSNSDGELLTRHSTIGRTNLLKRISRPLGATIDLDYAVAGNTYDLPYSIWTMSDVTVNDGAEGDGINTRKTAFEYANGQYDRHEREFYGFETVRIRELGYRRC